MMHVHFTSAKQKVLSPAIKKILKQKNYKNKTTKNENPANARLYTVQYCLISSCTVQYNSTTVLQYSIWDVQYCTVALLYIILQSSPILNHLFNTNEILASMILSLHNINFYQELMKLIRINIQKGTFDKFHDKYIDKL